MAYQSHNCDRRNLLQGGALFAAIAAFPSAAGAHPPRSAWAVAMGKYDAAKADRDRHTLAMLRMAEAPDEVIDENDRLHDAVLDRKHDLIAMPAPDRTALRWKLDRIFEPEEFDDGFIPAWGRSVLAQTQADISRLLGGA